ncbi:hypothetical protein M513_09951 [Trichuris suis]|uniref:Uncharacterized protein n=1 Tax=Trichuris suis TaxID=68888 RepID=A0A085LVY1_9BILA|nr:hypothetical protein M513_09951 [Trichuris suis]
MDRVPIFLKCFPQVLKFLSQVFLITIKSPCQLGTGLFKQLSCFEDLCAVSTSDVSEDGVSCNGLRYFHN